MSAEGNGFRWIQPRDQRTAGWLLLVFLAYSAAPVLWLWGRGELAEVGQEMPSPQLTVDVNHAGVAELSLLPGIGPGLAARIIRQRDLRPFEFIEQLRDVQGIGPKTLDKLRGLVICKPSTERGEGR